MKKDRLSLWKCGRVTFLFMFLLLFLGTFGVAITKSGWGVQPVWAAAPFLQNDENVSACVLLPSSWTYTKISLGNSLGCMADLVMGRQTISIKLSNKLSVDAAQAGMDTWQLSGMCTDANSGFQVGDKSFEYYCTVSITNAPKDLQYYVQFQRGCYWSRIYSDVTDSDYSKSVPKDVVQTIKDIAQRMDENIQALSDQCNWKALTGQVPGTGSSGSGGTFATGLGCSYNEANISEGMLACAATYTYAPGGATISYKWFLDSVEQSGDTADTFNRPDDQVTPGEHTITVIAVDTKSNTQSQSTSYKFTKSGEAPAPQEGEFSTTASCSYNYNKDEITCTTKVSNAPEGADLEYEWLFDGKRKGKETSHDIVVFVPPTYQIHNCLVRAKDVKTGKVSTIGYAEVTVGSPPGPLDKFIKLISPENAIDLLLPSSGTPVKLQPGGKAQVKQGQKTIISISDAYDMTRAAGIPQGVDLLISMGLTSDQSFEQGPGRALAFLAAPSRADPFPLFMSVDLLWGAVKIETLVDYSSVQLNTFTTVVKTDGKSAFVVAHNPETDEDEISAYSGLVTVEPQSEELLPFTLNAGQRISVSGDGMGPITDFSLPNSNQKLIVAGLVTVVGCVLVVSVFLVTLWVFRRGRGSRGERVSSTGNRSNLFFILGISVLALVCVVGIAVGAFLLLRQSNQPDALPTLTITEQPPEVSELPTDVPPIPTVDTGIAVQPSETPEPPTAIPPTPVPPTPVPTAFTGPPVPAGWRLVQSDLFDINANQWPTGEQATEFVTNQWSVDGGLYHWSALAHQAFSWQVWSNQPSITDFYLSVEARQVSGMDDADYGLAFRISQDGTFYRFGIQDTGKYYFIRMVDWNETKLIDWMPTYAVQAGEVNRLVVIGQGSNFTCYVNDQLVADVHDDAISSGIVGMDLGFDAVGAAVSMVFDNFTLYTP